MGRGPVPILGLGCKVSERRTDWPARKLKENAGHYHHQNILAITEYTKLTRQREQDNRGNTRGIAESVNMPEKQAKEADRKQK